MTTPHPETFAIVNIGRNVGDHPMSPYRWKQYKYATRTTLNLHGHVVGAGEGQSVWGGIPEAFATFHVTIHPARVPGLQAALATLAAHYNQEAVGYAEGTPIPATAQGE